MNNKIPYNVSEWRNVGKERGYWDYFKNQIRKKDEEELIKIITGAWCIELDSDILIKLVKQYYK